MRESVLRHNDVQVSLERPSWMTSRMTLQIWLLMIWESTHGSLDTKPTNVTAQTSQICIKRVLRQGMLIFQRGNPYPQEGQRWTVSEPREQSLILWKTKGRPEWKMSSIKQPRGILKVRRSKGVMLWLPMNSIHPWLSQLHQEHAKSILRSKRTEVSLLTEERISKIQGKSTESNLPKPMSAEKAKSSLSRLELQVLMVENPPESNRKYRNLSDSNYITYLLFLYQIRVDHSHPKSM
mmetsp:Transcript_644/g.1501  ORF Transcript_644/g.1501 Transcript_644/m.1501 type:complete len:237 (-) Transcript_644:681-1391(-)